MKPVLIDSTGGLEPVHDQAREDRLVQGAPQRRTWTLHEAGPMSAGIWECEVGRWRIAFPPGRQEYFHVPGPVSATAMGRVVARNAARGVANTRRVTNPAALCALLAAFLATTRREGPRPGEAAQAGRHRRHRPRPGRCHPAGLRG